MKNKLTVILASLSLAACSSMQTNTINTPINISPDKFQCETSGPRPTGDKIMESEVARYISKLEYSNTDCKTRLKEIRIILECFNDSKCDIPTLLKYMELIDKTKEE